MEPAAIGQCTFMYCKTLCSILQVVYYYNAALMSFIPIFVLLYLSAVYGLCFRLAHELRYCVIFPDNHSLYSLRMHCTLRCILFHIHHRSLTNFESMGTYISGYPPMLCYYAIVLQLYVTLCPMAK